MKKFLLLFVAVCVACVADAQRKKVSRAEVYDELYTTRGTSVYDFHYDEDGRLLSYDRNGVEFVRLTYNDAENTIRIEHFEDEEITEMIVAYLENGRITKINYEEFDEDSYTFNLYYNEAGELISMVWSDLDFMGNIEWANGNIIKGTGADGWYEYSLTDYDRLASFPYLMEFIDGIDGFDLFDVSAPFYYLTDYLGKRPKKLLAELKGVFDCDERSDYSYKFDAEGNVSEIIEEHVEDQGSYKWKYRVVFTYTTVSGINDVTAGGQDCRKAVYGLDGMQRPSVGKGLNIVKAADGTVRKVVVK